MTIRQHMSTLSDLRSDGEWKLFVFSSVESEEESQLVLLDSLSYFMTWICDDATHIDFHSSSDDDSHNPLEFVTRLIDVAHIFCCPLSLKSSKSPHNDKWFGDNQGLTLEWRSRETQNVNLMELTYQKASRIHPFFSTSQTKWRENSNNFPWNLLKNH